MTPRTRRSRMHLVGTATVIAVLLTAPLAPAPVEAATCQHTAAAYASAGRGGVGQDPIEISTGAHLLHLAATSADWGKDFLQTADIDLTGCTWTPIGTSPNAFTGSYNGGERTISGLVINTPGADDVGMFGWVNGGSVSRLRLTGVSITGRDSVGGLIGRQQSGDVAEVHVAGTVTGRNYVGGMIGDKSNGGILAATSEVGVTSTGQYVGGLVGYTGSGVTINRTMASGDVTSTDSFVGGLVGNNLGTITRSAALGAVTASGIVGGLIGYNANDVTDVFARGAVTGGTDRRTGGLIGDFGDGTLRRGYATGLVTSPSPPTQVGGLVGQAFGNAAVADSFWDTTTTGQGSDPTEGAGQAVGRTTAQLRDVATYTAAGWAIVAGWQSYDPTSRVWGICAGVNAGYPALLWTSASDPCGTDTVAAGPPVTPVLSAGALPRIEPGRGVWRRADDTDALLVASSPAARQVRYSGPTLRVTFTGAAGTSVGGGLVVDRDGTVTCEVCFDLLAVGGVIEAWVLSEPRLVAAHRTDAETCQTFAIPVGAPLDGSGPVAAGTHTLQLALPTSTGMQAVNVGITVRGAVPSGVPAGEGPVGRGSGDLRLWSSVLAGLLGLTLMATAGRGLRSSRRAA